MRITADKVRPGFLACVSATVAICMVFALCAPADTGRAPAGVSANAPPLPYVIYGHVRDSGGTGLSGVTVKITNEDTGNWNTTATDGTGAYQFDLANMASAYSDADTVNVTADYGAASGYNVTTVNASTGGQMVDLKLETTVPEGSVPIALCIATVAIAMAAAAWRRKQ